MAYLFWHSIWHSFWHILWHTLTFYLTFNLASILTFSLTLFLPFYLASILAFIWHSLRRLAEVRQCPLRSPEEKDKDEEEKATLIESRDPHLAGGEKHWWFRGTMNSTRFTEWVLTTPTPWRQSFSAAGTRFKTPRYLKMHRTWKRKSSLSVHFSICAWRWSSPWNSHSIIIIVDLLFFVSFHLWLKVETVRRFSVWLFQLIMEKCVSFPCSICRSAASTT